jgi:CubicO group peptidase (beta-lactamase class C family)
VNARIRALALSGFGVLLVLFAVTRGRPHHQVALEPASALDFSDPLQAWDFRPVREYIQEVMEERGLPSVSVAVAVGDSIAWEEAFGWADVEARRPATPHTPYSLASISKPMTATAVLLLREEGRVDLDAPLDDYMGGGRLKGLAGPAQEATVRRVLSHTAGLPLHYTFFYRNEGVAPPPPAETLRRYGILVFPPGERFEYSNLGYGLLGFLIQNVSGEAYRDFLDRRVFRPLGLTHTSVGVPPGMEGEWARRYGPEGQLLPFYDFDHPGASAVFSSAHDLVRFGAFHLGHAVRSDREEGGAAATPTLLPDPVLRKMHTPQEPPPGNGYGLGWFVEEEYGFRKVYHTGSMPGVSTMLALYPDQDVAIVVLLNALDREQRVEIAREIAAVVIPGYREARAGAPEAPEGPGDRGDLAPEVLGRWEGILSTWEGEIPAWMEVEAGGSGVLGIGDASPVEIRRVAFRDGILTAQAPGRIPTSGALRHPAQTVSLELVLRRVGAEADDDWILEGQATAQTTAYPSHFALTSYLRLAPRN